MYNPVKLGSFCPKSCFLRFSSYLFMNVMQQPGSDLPYDTVKGPRAQKLRLFWFSPIFGRKMLQKPPKFQGPRPAQCKTGPSNNMVSRCNHILYHFSIITCLHLAIFTRRNTFEKKISGLECSLNKFLNLN